MLESIECWRRDMAFLEPMRHDPAKVVELAEYWQNLHTIDMFEMLPVIMWLLSFVTSPRLFNDPWSIIQQW